MSPEAGPGLHDADAGVPPALARAASERGSLLTSAGVVFAGNLVARALGFLFPLVLARVTGRADFALVYFFINTGFSVGELVLTGFPTAITRHIAVDRLDPGRGRWIAAGVLGGLPLLLISVVGGELLSWSAGAMPVLMSIVIVGLTIDAYYFSVLRGLERYALLIAYRISANLVQIIGLGLLALMHAATATNAVVLYAAVYLVPMIVIELREAPLTSLLKRAGRVTRPVLRATVRFAMPALVSGTAYGIVFGFDVFFVRVFSPEALADYGAARTLALPMLMVPYAIGIVLMPRTASLSERARLHFLWRSLGITTVLGVTLVGGYLLFGPYAVGALLPASYNRAIEPLHTLAPSLGLLGVYSVLSQWWLGRGSPVAPAVSLSLGAMATLIAHATLTANLGAIGAGLAIGVGSCVALLVLGTMTMGHHRQVVRA